MKLQDIVGTKEYISSGHRACAGCGELIGIRQIMLVASACGYKPIISNATGCLEVTTTLYPYSAWAVGYIHCAFENAAAVASGIEAAYSLLKKTGKITEDKIKVVGIAGDGGSSDIGFQALSGAFERKHDILFITFDNQAYMNTGIQRSSSTPKYAHTNTSPAGKKIPGKLQVRKNLALCMVYSGANYVAQASISHIGDLINKAKKAFEKRGPCLLVVLASCPLGWGFPPQDTIKMAREAVETKAWVLFEIEDGVLKINYKPSGKKSIIDWLRKQQRFAHLFKPTENKSLLQEIEKETEENYQRLLQLEGKILSCF